MLKIQGEISLNTKRLLLSCLISIIFIVVTALFGLIYGANEFCFFFHLIPFAVSFGGGSILITIIYYIVLFLIIALIVFGVIKPSKERTNNI
jgi:hypothetical protein